MAKKKLGRPKGSKNSKSSAKLPSMTPSQLALIESVKSDEKIYYCAHCGRAYKKQQMNFPKLQSELYKGNDKYSPICFRCVEEMYSNYEKNLGEDEAIRRMCIKLDIYFCDEALAASRSASNNTSRIRSYISRAMYYYRRGRGYDDTLDQESAYYISPEKIEEAKDIMNGEKSDAVIDDKVIQAWGVGLAVDDYKFLENELHTWKVGYSIDGKSQESIVREICIFDLQKTKALSNNNMKLFQDLCNDRQKALDRAHLTPKAEASDDRLMEKPIGKMIEMVENEEPIPEPLDAFKDVDGIHKLIRVYFIGHLCKMLGLKNKYVDEYEEEMNQYTAKVAELEGSEPEDVFDYLVEHGFADGELDTAQTGEGETDVEPN